MNAINDDFLRGNDGGVLRFITAGSVDDGKSTLIGRLLYDAKGVFADQLAAVARAKNQRVAPGEIDFALLTDGLEAEREQGITIDVAYRYFATPRRSFIVADAPGHEQYTRNMITGASTAEVVVILIDATLVSDGQLLTQTKRHSTIAQLLGIDRVIVAVNKMDRVNFDEKVFDAISDSYYDLALKIGIPHVDIVPISALRGDNVVTRSDSTPWYDGPTLLSLLETVPLAERRQTSALRFPVQWVMRHGGDREDGIRRFTGRIASGELRVGDRIRVAPGEQRAAISAIYRGEAHTDIAIAGDAVAVELDRHVDVSRGDVLTLADDSALSIGKAFEAELCWLDTAALNPARTYLLKQGTRTTAARIGKVLSRREIHDLSVTPADANPLTLNDIGRVTVATRDPLLLDDFNTLPDTGAFILIDEATHQTAAAGMIRR